jgi:hypothetical protein
LRGRADDLAPEAGPTYGIGYIRKRGCNERYSYNYVAAADIAGTVGDILAELGVVVIPRPERSTYEAPTPGRAEGVRVARVIMAYASADVNTDEEITAKVAGEGLDVGDKASYKAMTGALEYSLLQSFLLAAAGFQFIGGAFGRNARIFFYVDRNEIDIDLVAAFYALSWVELVRQRCRSQDFEAKRLLM